MKLFITGANGQLGRCLIDRAVDDAEIDFEAFGSGTLDITNIEQVRSEITGYAPDFVVNAAAYTAVDKAEEDAEQASLVNEVGARNLALVCAELNVPLIHVSTDYVFNGKSSIPYREQDSTDPIGVYGRTKLAGEVAIAEVYPKHLIFRTAWLFSEYGNNFVKTMLRLAESRTELSVVEDQLGCPTYAGDLAQAILSVCKQLPSDDSWGTYHYVGATQCSWADFAHKIFSFGTDSGMFPHAVSVTGIPTSAYPTAAERPAYSVLDTAKIQAEFGLKPRFIEESLPEVLSLLSIQND